MQALAEADAAKQFGGALAGIATAIQLKGQHDVLQRVQAVQQLERLEDKADVFGAYACALILIERGQRVARQVHFPGARQIKPGEQTEQSRLSRAGGADDGEAVALGQLQREVGQDAQLAFRAGYHFVKVPGVENVAAHEGIRCESG